jgi:hypothetical protein
MQETLESSFVTYEEVLAIYLTAYKRFHFCVAAPFRDAFVSCLSQRGKCTLLTAEEASGSNDPAMHRIFLGAFRQVTQPRASTGHDTSNLCLHLCIRLDVIRAVIPVDESMEIGQVAHIKSLPLDLPSHKKRHLVMAAQLSSALVSCFVKGCLFA